MMILDYNIAEPTVDGLRQRALELAQQWLASATTAEILARAEAYYGFMAPKGLKRGKRLAKWRVVVWVGAFAEGFAENGTTYRFGVYPYQSRALAMADGVKALVRVELEEGRFDTDAGTEGDRR